ncbi:MAG TPA: condensation domain-containing protein, partial [Longimicrobiaceae bacterium]|nr:condensation domain-containing protein [Longimicrobiaceae bacterium]
DTEPAALAPLRLLMAGGEALSPAHLRRIRTLHPALRIVNGYGPSECTVFSTAHVMGVESEIPSPVPIGRPMGDRCCYVLDAALRPVPVGAAGELFVGGAGVPRGYLGRPGLTAAVLVPDPFSAEPGARLYRTGDRVCWRAEGTIDFLGRMDQQVKIRGFRVEPGEVEAVLASLPGVRQAAVAVHTDERGDRRLVAYAVTDATDGRTLRTRLAERLPAYLVPASVTVLDALPMTASGKVDRRALPAPDAAVEGGRAAESATERTLAEIWREVLGVPDVGATDDFFALGGHSLHAMQIASRSRDAFGVALPLRAVFDALTVERLAAEVESRIAAGAGRDAESASGPRLPVLPASSAQQRLWLSEQMAEMGAVYNMALAVRLRGALDAGALGRALAEIARRHETLRTGFTTVQGRPAQVIHPPLAEVLGRTDLSHLVPAEREEEMRRRLADDATRPFDLAAGRPFRATLLRLAGDEHVLSLVIHHAVGDGWSHGVLFREMEALYAAFARGDASPLPELPIQYADFAGWEAAHLASGADEGQVAFWRDELRDAPALLAYPTDRPRPAVQTYAGRTFDFPIPADLAQGVRALAQAHRATPFMALLAAWQAVLARGAGQPEVVVGSPVAGRRQAEVEGLIGFFVNMLPLRTRLGDDPTVAELLARVRETTLNAYANQDVPFDRLVQALGVERNRRHGPVFQAVFVLQNGHELALRLGDLGVEIWHPETGTSEFDLNLSVEEAGDAYIGRLTYRTDLFDAATIAGIASAFRTALEEAAAHPERRLSELAIPLPAAHRPAAERVIAPAPPIAAEAGAATSSAGDRAPSTVAAPNPSSAVDAGRASSATERALAAIWAEVLDAGRVGPDDDFLALGGTETGAAHVVERIRAMLRVEVPVRAVLDARTVRALAARIDRLPRIAEVVGGIPRTPRSGPLPASFAQRRLWLVDRLRPGTAAYNVSAAFRIRGPLHVPALERALGEIVARHESLRTTFATVDGEPVQVIAPATPFRLPVADVASGSPEDGEREAARLAAAEGGRPFDLEHGPLFRASLIRVAPDDHVLTLTLHHAVTDGWSMGVLHGELSALYAAFAADGESPLAPLPVQYADFAAWERGRADGAEMRADLAYWKRRLDGAPALLELPADRPRPAVPSHRGGYVPVEVAPELAAALRAFARAQGATPFMALLAGWQALLARASGQDDVVVGSPTAGRSRPELEGLIGFFVNMLPLRAELGADPTFRELLAQVRETTLQAHAHDGVPFDRLVEEVAPERTLRHGPVFQVSFAFHNAPAGAFRLGAATAVPFGDDGAATKFDLDLALEDGAGGLRGALGYASDLFDAATARRLASQLQILLAEAVAHPDRPLSTLPLAAADERAALLAEWSAPLGAQQGTVHALFAAQAAATPDAVAVGAGGSRMTYAELDARANRLARRLRARGVGPESRVGLSMQRGPELVVAVVAILKAGGAYVPLDPAYPAERLAFMLADAGVCAVVATRELAARLPLGDTPLVCLDDVAEALLVAAQSPDPLDEASDADGLAYVVYTSGSTGTPKGVGVPHRAGVRLVRDADFAAMGSDEVFLQLAPVAFDASTLELWAPLLNGGRIAPFPPQPVSPAALADFVEREGVTTLWLTAGLFHQVVDERPGCFASVRQLLAGGDVLSPAHVRRVMEMHPALRVVNGYGPTENTTFTCCHTIRPGDADRASIPLGRAIHGTRAYVLDGAMAPAGVGMPGELFAG